MNFYLKFIYFKNIYHIDVIYHALDIQNNSHLKLERAGGDQKIIYRVQENVLHLNLHKKIFENKLRIRNYFKNNITFLTF